MWGLFNYIIENAPLIKGKNLFLLGKLLIKKMYVVFFNSPISIFLFLFQYSRLKLAFIIKSFFCEVNIEVLLFRIDKKLYYF